MHVCARHSNFTCLKFSNCRIAYLHCNCIAICFSFYSNRERGWVICYGFGHRLCVFHRYYCNFFYFLLWWKSSSYYWSMADLQAVFTWLIFYRFAYLYSFFFNTLRRRKWIKCRLYKFSKTFKTAKAYPSFEIGPITKIYEIVQIGGVFLQNSRSF